MKTTLIQIGNSRGIRIPKPLLAESGLGNEVELQVKKGEIKIVATLENQSSSKDTVLFSEKVLSADWDRPDEDKAWASLQ